MQVPDGGKGKGGAQRDGHVGADKEAKQREGKAWGDVKKSGFGKRLLRKKVLTKKCLEKRQGRVGERG